jgi:hypothetical protein
MPIRVKCETCGKTLILRDELAGRRGRCPNCHSTIEVPDAAGRTTRPKPDTDPGFAMATDAASLAGVDFSKPLPPLEWLVEGPDGQQLGPVDLETARSWVLRELIPPTAKVQGPTTQGPREIRRVAEFQATLEELDDIKAHRPIHTIGTARIGKHH